MSVLLNVKEAAERLRLSPCSVRRLMKRGTLPYHRLGKRQFFNEEDLATFLGRCQKNLSEVREAAHE
ncbi:MAG: helix-turn-helix domain-containing protein [Treponematales bacterium]